MYDGGYVLCEDVNAILPPGYYTPGYEMTPTLVPHTVKTDELFKPPGSSCKLVLDEMNEFWANEDRYREHGLLWKRGILLFGPPGSGKTCVVELVCDKLIEDGGVAIVGNRGMSDLQEALEMIRQAEPERRIVVVLEDLDRLADRHESDLLSVLDGEKQIDNVVFLATTNYLDKLPDTIVKRPSRFDLVHEVPMPGVRTRRWYLQKKLGRKVKKTELEKVAKKSDGFSFAHLKEVCVRILVFNRSADKALASVREMV